MYSQLEKLKVVQKIDFRGFFLIDMILNKGKFIINSLKLLFRVNKFKNTH